MLRFKLVSALFFIISALLLYLAIEKGFSFWWLALNVLVYSAVVFYGVTYLSAGFFVKAVCAGPDNKKELCITFDDGPHPEITPRILQILKEHSVPAAFFVIGKNIDGNEALLKKTDQDGHIIGNHTFNHSFWFDLKSPSGMKLELKQTDDKVKEVLGKYPLYFRPPYGVTNPPLYKALRDTRYSVIGWNVRSFDTVVMDKNRLLDKLKKALKPGAIYLFHDTNDRTVEILESFILYAKENGYSFVSIEKFVNKDAYAVN